MKGWLEERKDLCSFFCKEEDWRGVERIGVNIFNHFEVGHIERMKQIK